MVTARRQIGEPQVHSAEIRPLTSLRGLAALWVLIHHITTIEGTKAALSPDGLFMKFAGKGWFGVDIFFILSGYILMNRYFHEKLDLRVFYARRFARIYPLYITSIAVLVVMVAAASLLHVPLNHPEIYNLKSLIFSVLMLQAVFFPEPPWNFVSWSLSFEMLCYLGLPFLIDRLRGTSAFQRAAAFVVVLGIYLIMGSLYQNPTAQLPGLARSFSAFFCGALGFLVFEPKNWPPFLAEICLGLLAATAVFAASPVYLIPVALILIPAMAGTAGWAAKLLSTSVLVRIGTISYSIYLLQVPVYYVVNKFFPISVVHNQLLAKAGMITVFVALVIGVAEMSYRLLEAPSRRWLVDVLAPTRREVHEGLT